MNPEFRRVYESGPWVGTDAIVRDSGNNFICDAFTRDRETVVCLANAYLLPLLQRFVSDVANTAGSTLDGETVVEAQQLRHLLAERLK